MNGDNYSLIRAIRGPITLITVGGLFVLHNFTQYRFDQTWPVLLIVFGLLSLLQRGVAAQAPPAPAPPPPPRGFARDRATGYAQSSYAQTPPSAAEPVKGGFGTSAPPRPENPPSPSASNEGGTV